MTLKDADRSAALREAVTAAVGAQRPLAIHGGGTRRGLMAVTGDGFDVLDVGGHRGIVAFEPSELVVTARAGTLLSELEAVVAAAGQCLPFDPPRFGPASTLGGAVASGLAGPARPWQGAVRDAVLGITLLDGRGGIGRFGGQVMKNVAGYDVARLNVGAMGSLGVLLDVSLRLLPSPMTSVTRVLELGLGQAFGRMARLGRRPLPITAMAWETGTLRVRLAGSEAGVAAAVASVGGEPCPDGEDYWVGLRDRQLPNFEGDGPLWRLSVPATAPQPDLSANWLLDWGGAQRWCWTDDAPERVFQAASELGGHAMRLVPGVQRAPLPPAQLRLQQRIKAVFDPSGLFNPGVLYPGQY
ncbi:MAG: glycolate oxidase subunit GlcE [Gammaproteobacteria bacterium]|nr:glycolate oxidase subunit GlcE [Gammaproteobacteria bacterium]